MASESMKLISIAEAARFTGLSQKLIRQMVKDGKLDTYLPPGYKRPRILRPELEGVIADMRVKK